MEWISIKERLPKTDVIVLIVTSFKSPLMKRKKKFVQLSTYSRILKSWSEPEDQSLETVTHWMPLPKPPKEK